MSVRENSIISPRQEIKDLENAIEDEKMSRRSLSISASPSYYAAQKEHILEQLKMFQDKLKVLEERYANTDELEKESLARTARYKKRLLMLKNRDKIAKMERLEKELRELREEMK